MAYFRLAVRTVRSFLKCNFLSIILLLAALLFIIFLPISILLKPVTGFSHNKTVYAHIPFIVDINVIG